MPQFLYRIQLVRPAILVQGPTDLEASIIAEHFDYHANLVEKGVAFVVGRTLHKDERTFGIVIFMAASELEAESIMHSDPVVKHGVMKAELFPFKIALWSSKGPA